MSELIFWVCFHLLFRVFSPFKKKSKTFSSKLLFFSFHQLFPMCYFKMSINRKLLAVYLLFLQDSQFSVYFPSIFQTGWSCHYYVSQLWWCLGWTRVLIIFHVGYKLYIFAHFFKACYQATFWLDFQDKMNYQARSSGCISGFIRLHSITPLKHKISTLNRHSWLTKQFTLNW